MKTKNQLSISIIVFIFCVSSWRFIGGRSTPMSITAPAPSWAQSFKQNLETATSIRIDAQLGLFQILIHADQQGSIAIDMLKGEKKRFYFDPNTNWVWHSSTLREAERRPELDEIFKDILPAIQSGTTVWQNTSPSAYFPPPDTAADINSHFQSQGWVEIIFDSGFLSGKNVFLHFLPNRDELSQIYVILDNNKLLLKIYNTTFNEAVPAGVFDIDHPSIDFGVPLRYFEGYHTIKVSD